MVLVLYCNLLLSFLIEKVDCLKRAMLRDTVRVKINESISDPTADYLLVD